jgi:hypothetical protein
MAHYGGAEKVSPDEQTKIDAFYQFVSPWGDALNALWTDLAPIDNQLQIKLPSE